METIINQMRRKGRRRFIETYEFPQPLRDKLREELGGAREAEIALDGLRGWYLAWLYADGALLGMPSRAVDEAWHEMILMTREYTWFCQRAFGRYLHHSPDTTLAVSMDDILPRTLAVVDRHELPMTLFSADADAGMQDGYTWGASDLRRMRAANAVQGDRPRRRRAGGSSSATSSGFAGGCAGGGGDGGGGGGCGGGGGGGGCGGGGG